MGRRAVFGFVDIEEVCGSSPPNPTTYESRLRGASLRGLFLRLIQVRNYYKEVFIKHPLGRQTMVTVNEPGLYCLILRSRKSEARDFTRWITHDVLPALRRTGSYQMPQEDFVEKKLAKFSRRDLILLAMDAETECEELRDLVEDLAPKAEFFDRVAKSADTFSFGATAKMMEIPGFGRNNLIKFLRDKGVLMANNEAMQRYVDRGYFHIVQRDFSDEDGNIRISAVTRGYEKGVDFIRRLLDQAFPEGRDWRGSVDASLRSCEGKKVCNAMKRDKVTGRFSA